MHSDTLAVYYNLFTIWTKSVKYWHFFDCLKYRISFKSYSLNVCTSYKYKDAKQGFVYQVENWLLLSKTPWKRTF